MIAAKLTLEVPTKRSVTNKCFDIYCKLLILRQETFIDNFSCIVHKVGQKCIGVLWLLIAMCSLNDTELGSNAGSQQDLKPPNQNGFYEEQADLNQDESAQCTGS
ncbi:hypothetical protein HUJ04_003337 [Dendroctonus ponderosae]|nr:hypothetical protein HUJ04_003337 [Dendroctonus ponderosae]